jgi:hypothetical protein
MFFISDNMDAVGKKSRDSVNNGKTSTDPAVSETTDAVGNNPKDSVNNVETTTVGV